jgi:hypothetical protein
MSSSSRGRFVNGDVELVPGNSLRTATPEEGRALAVRLARLTIKLTQPDPEVRTEVRNAYANEAAALLAVAQVVATEFATIAAANEYWRWS